MKLTVIGCGRWGTFLAWYLDRLGHAVTLYGREGSARMQRLMDERRNDYLQLPERVRLTTVLAEAAEAETIVISIGSQNLQDLMSQLAALNIGHKTIVLCMKGLEAGTGRRLSEIVNGTLNATNRVAVWLGPGHVQEFCAGVPNCMVIDSADASLKETLAEAFAGDLIRFYYGEDLLGNEIGAAAKNVIGIAAGMLDGLSLTTLKGALMSRGTREVARLIAAMGGNELSAYGFATLEIMRQLCFPDTAKTAVLAKRLCAARHMKSLQKAIIPCARLRRLAHNTGWSSPSARRCTPSFLNSVTRAKRSIRCSNGSASVS